MTKSMSFKGSESVVNSYTSGYQGNPNIGVNPATGGYQVVWESNGQDGFGLGVYGRNYTSSHAKDGGEIAISMVTLGDQINPDVAFNEDGNGSWVWQTNAVWSIAPETDFDADPVNYLIAENYRTRSRTFGFEDPDYNVLNNEVVRDGRYAPEGNGHNNYDPRVISLGEEHFAMSAQVVFFDTDSSVFVDEYTTVTDHPQTADTAVPRSGAWSRNFTEDEKNPRGQTTSHDIAQIDDNTILVANTMTSSAQGGNLGIIQFQPFIRQLGTSFLAGDNGRGDAFKLGDRVELDESGTTGPAAYPTIAILKDGGFVITWSEYNYQDDPDNGHFDVYAQVFNADYSPRSSAVLAHRPSTDTQVDSEVAALNDGGFIVTFLGRDSDGAGIMAQRFDKNGIQLGGNFKVNKTEAGSQSDAVVEVLPNGDIVVAWESEGGDGSDDAVMTQVLSLSAYTSAMAQQLTGTDAKEKFDTGGKADVVYAGGGNDVVKGGGGKDALYGEDGKDKIYGGGGKDILDGGEGNDKMKGQGGKDVFIFNGGKDVVKDFQNNKDKVHIERDLYTGNGTLNMAKLEKLSDMKKGDLILNFGDGNKLTIQDVKNFDQVSDELSFI